MQLETNSTSNSKRLAGYAAAGLAALTASAGTAEAQITHVEVNESLEQGGILAFDLGSEASFYFINTPGIATAVSVDLGNGGIAGQSVAGLNYVSNLTSGVNVSTQNFVTGPGTLAVGDGYSNSQFVDTDGFIAFSFDVGDGTQFGWAQLLSNLDSPINTYTIVDFAFAAPGQAIAVGQTAVAAVPEPTSLAVLALGACGVALNRRRRQAALAS